MNINFNFGIPSMGLRHALLVYEGGKHTAITCHQVSDGVIQPGKPLDLPSFRRLIDQDVETKTDLAWQHPRLLAQHPAWHVWWTPAGMHEVFIDGKMARYWFPTLVWAGHRSQQSLFLWATPDATPTTNSKAYRLRLGPEEQNHIHQDCGVCIGSMDPKSQSPVDWEKAFWESSFKTNGGMSAKPYALKAKAKVKQVGTISSEVSRVVARR
jgi:hypothetical protein